MVKRARLCLYLVVASASRRSVSKTSGERRGGTGHTWVDARRLNLNLSRDQRQINPRRLRAPTRGERTSYWSVRAVVGVDDQEGQHLFGESLPISVGSMGCDLWGLVVCRVGSMATQRSTCSLDDYALLWCTDLSSPSLGQYKFNRGGMDFDAQTSILVF